MLLKSAVVATLITLPALFACKERRYEGSTPEATQTPESAPRAEGYGREPTGGAPTTVAQEEARAREVLKENEPETTAATADNTIATAALVGKVNGMVTFFKQTDGDVHTTIALRGAAPGSYAAYLFTDSSCEGVTNMAEPFASEERTIDQRERDAVGNQKDDVTPEVPRVPYKAIGTIAVPTDGDASMTFDENVGLGNLGGGAVAMFPVSADTSAQPKPELSSCGEVKVTRPLEPQG